ncbi:MAG: DUF6348 family protein [Tannerellaceae bacterium]|nr:DUF6348 family protein [Tannerellaceae bacterium]
MNEELIKAEETKLTHSLADLFQKHAISCELQDDAVVFPGQQIKGYCQLQIWNSDKTRTSLSLYVILEIGVNKYIEEPFGGMGDTLQDALVDAWKNFVLTSFHVLLDAFFTKEYKDEVFRREITVGQQAFELIQGPLGRRGNLPEGYSHDWVDSFIDEMVQTHKFTDGIHWIRIFWGQNNGQELTHEVVIDNQPDEVLKDGQWKKNLPLTEGFYTLRLFMILQNKNDINRLAGTVAWMENQENDDKVAYLGNNGVPVFLAERAVTLIPMAFAQVFLEREFGIGFPDEAIVINKEEQEFTYPLQEDSVYTDAIALATGMLENGAHDMYKFNAILYQSAELNAISKALQDGFAKEKLGEIKFQPSRIYWNDYSGE